MNLLSLYIGRFGWVLSISFFEYTGKKPVILWRGQMELLKVIILGIIQGLAEFLPISSSGHLALFQQILHLNLEGGMLLDILLHVGTLLAVFLAFWSDIKKLICEGFGILGDCFYNIGRFLIRKGSYHRIVNSPYRKFVIMILVSTIPTGILGILLKDVIEYAMTTVFLPGIGLIITALLLLLADNVKPGRKGPDETGYGEAGAVGIAQGIATFPGISRSGTTIAACLMCGFEKNFAVEYSFILSIPAVLGSMVLELKDFATEPVAGEKMRMYLLGALIAAVVGYICIKTMLIVVRGRKYKYFAYYCLLAGTLAVVWALV